MEQISGFLERLKRKVVGLHKDKQTILSVLNRYGANKFTSDNLRLLGSVIVLKNTPAALRSDIFLQKNVILKTLEELGIKVSDIR